MDPNQQGQPTQGGSVPPTSPMPGIPPEQTSGMPPASQGQSPQATPPAQPVSPATQPTSPVFSTGTVTSSTASPQPSDPAPSSMPFTARRFSQSAGPAAFQPAQQQTIASSTGSAAPKKGLSKGMIIGLIAIAILAIAAVVTGIIVSQSSGNKSSTASTTSAPINMAELTTAYNNLANYIAFGDEGTSEKKLSDGKTYTTYELLKLAAGGLSLGPILEADKMLDTESSARRNEFFQKFDQLYQQLPEGISVQYNINLEDIYDYFHEFSTVGVVSDASIISRYQTEGMEPTRRYIENTVTTKSDKRYVVEYADYLRNYNLESLNLINDIKTNSNCTVELNNTNQCNLEASASYETYYSAMMIVMVGDAYEIRAGYQGAAIQALLNIYGLLHESEGGSR